MFERSIRCNRVILKVFAVVLWKKQQVISVELFKKTKCGFKVWRWLNLHPWTQMSSSHLLQGLTQKVVYPADPQGLIEVRTSVLKTTHSFPGNNGLPRICRFPKILGISRVLLLCKIAKRLLCDAWKTLDCFWNIELNRLHKASWSVPYSSLIVPLSPARPHS